MNTSPHLATTPATGFPPSGGALSVASLIHLVTTAHDAGQADRAAERVAAALAAAAPVVLPLAYRRPGAQKYARHLIHRDAARDLVLIAMVWSPGQGTPVHDHGGYWCIEQVLAGRLDSDIYHAREERADGAFRLELVDREVQQLGAIALLRPPVEMHAVRNTGVETTLTLNIYGGELKQCRAFVPLAEDGWYRAEERQLAYDD